MATAAVADRPNWSLPAALAERLAQPVEQALDALLGPAVPVSTPSPAPAAPTAPFLSALDAIPDARTANNAPAYSSTGEALVDLFHELSPGVEADKAFSLLEDAWKVDPMATLKIVFQARSIHEGKGFKAGFFRCAAWLWENHPRTLLANLHMLVDPTCERKRSKKRDAAKAERERAANNGIETLGDDGEVEENEEPEYPPRPHGSFDDLNDLLVLAINGQLTTEYKGTLNAIDQALAPAFAAEYFAPSSRSMRTGDNKRGRCDGGFSAIGRAAIKEMKKAAAVDDDDDETVVDEASDKEEDDVKTGSKRKAKGQDPWRKAIKENTLSFQARLARCGTRNARAAVIKERAKASLASDAKLQALYVAVVDLYVQYIRADLDRLDRHRKYIVLPEEQRRADGYGKEGSSPYLFGMSYAGKWAPTPGKSADKQLYLATALAAKLFPDEDTKRARRRFQAEVLAPLRAVLSVPETKFVKGAWTIDYTKVPARAMARHQDDFEKHDEVRFGDYLDKVAAGTKTIAGASMMPHELLCQVLHGSKLRQRVANGQWNTLVDSVRSSSDKDLANCIAVADVSGSMGSIRATVVDKDRPSPIFPCVALTLLMTELARPPWNGAFITFSSDPKLERVDNTLPLAERAQNLSNAHWGMSTDYRKVFETILWTAKNANLAPEDMVKRVFVFSDMQFNDSTRWGDGPAFNESEHAGIVRRFEEEGYPMPELVYWDLQASCAKPVRADTPGTALVSGFNASLLKYFIRALGEGDEEDEEEVEEEKEDEPKDEWEKVTASMETVTVGEDKEETKEKKDKKKPDPMEHLMKIIGAPPFEGVTVVD